MVRESVRNIKGIASVFVVATACFLFGGISENTYAEAKFKLEANDKNNNFVEITDSTKIDGLKYDSKTNTLELNNYDSTKTGYAYFKFAKDTTYSDLDTLKVKVTGKNVLTGRDNAGFHSFANLLITGKGSLDIKDLGGDLTNLKGTCVTIDGPTVNIYGFDGNSKVQIDCERSVTIKSANVNLIDVIGGISGRYELEIKDSEINISQAKTPDESNSRNHLLSGDTISIDNSIVNMEVNGEHNFYGIYATYGNLVFNDSKFNIKVIPKYGVFTYDEKIRYPRALYGYEVKLKNVDIIFEVCEYNKSDEKELMGVELISAYEGFELENVNVIVTGEKAVVEKLGDFGNKGNPTAEKMYVVFSCYKEVDEPDVEIRKFESTDVAKLNVDLKNDSEAPYTGEPVKPELDLNGLIEGKDVEISYENNDRLGLAYIVVKGVGMFNGTKKIPFIITGKQVIDGPKVGTKITDGKFIYTIKKQAQRVIECKAVDGKPVFTESNELNPGSVAVTKLKKKSLKKVNINSEVVIDGFKYQITEIGKKAFKNNKKIKQVNIKSEYLTKIGNYAFANCKKLKKVKINAKALKKIGKKAFYKKGKKAKKVVVYIKKYGKKNWKKAFKKAKCKNFKLKVK